MYEIVDTLNSTGDNSQYFYEFLIDFISLESLKYTLPLALLFEDVAIISFIVIHFINVDDQIISIEVVSRQVESNNYAKAIARNSLTFIWITWLRMFED